MFVWIVHCLLQVTWRGRSAKLRTSLQRGSRVDQMGRILIPEGSET